MDTAGAERVWQELARAIGEIYKKNASSLSFEELYRKAYNLVLHKYGSILYTGVADTITAHLSKVAEGVSAAPTENLLLRIARAWDEHKVTLGMIRDILMYMDRTYVVQHKKVPVYALGLQIFRTTIVYHQGVRDRLRECLLNNISDERNGQLIDRGLMKVILSMLVDLNVDGSKVYEEEFEGPFLEQSKIFYRQESQIFLSQNTCSDYIKKAGARLEEESARISNYLSPSTEPALKHTVESEFISKQAKTLVEMDSSGCEFMMRESKYQDLANM